MNIRKAMNIEASSNSEVKLSKMATTIMNGDRKVVDKSLKNIKLTDWLGLAQNPLLTDDDIREMYKSMTQQNAEERTNGTKEATKTRNMGARGKVRKLLSMHPNLSEKSIDDLLNSKTTFGVPNVLNNPNVTPKQLDTYFEKKIMTTAQGDGYNFVTFGKLMVTKNITKELASKWYERLVKYADWTYKDNQWYAIVNAYLEFKDCPYNVLEDICKAPAGKGDGSFMDTPEQKRRLAIKHQNAKSDLVSIAYEATEFEEYLPDTVKDIFLF